MTGFRKLLAELLVITAGVLIALATDSAWQDRQDRARERELHQALLGELRTNLEILDRDIGQNRLARQQLERWAELMLSQDPETDYADTPQLFAEAQGTARFDPARGVLDGAIATGELALIRSNDFRQGLTGWLSRAEEARLSARSTNAMSPAFTSVFLRYEPGTPMTVSQEAALRGFLALADFNFQLMDLRSELVSLIELGEQVGDRL